MSPRRIPTAYRCPVGLAIALALTASPAAAQEPPDTTGGPVPVDSVVVTPMSPRGAFIRSMILPGWGQSAFGSYFRGGVFFTGWAGNWFMNFRNQVRLDNARDRYGLRRSELRDSLIFSPPAEDVPPNPDSMRAVLDSTDLLQQTVLADSAGNDLRKLVRARKQQREDWIAWTVFWILASGVDGYVTAHLSDFPATIDVDPGRDGSMTFRVEVPLPRRRP